jgi:hypothetical protein
MTISGDGSRVAKKAMIFIVLQRLFPAAPMQTIKCMAEAIKKRVAGMNFDQMQKALKEIFSQHNVSDEEIATIAEAIIEETGINDAELRAKEIAKLRGKEASKYETFCVSKVRSKKTGKTRTLITSSTDHKTAPENIELKESEEFVNNAPHLVRRPVRGEDGKVLKDEKGKIITQTFEKVEVDGKIIEIPYDKSKETRHHAEQKLLKSLSEDDEIVEIVPTRPCCEGCQKALGENLEKVPPHLKHKK